MRESESERAWRRLARRRKDGGSFPREDGDSSPCPSAKEERRGRRDTSPEHGKMGSLWKFLLRRETVMHVSPISVTKRLLAAFCPRDNSLPFFMAAPISQLRNYSRKVADTLRNVENAKQDGYSSLSQTLVQAMHFYSR